jgi:HD superfamily phosphohydrolase YqeK
MIAAAMIDLPNWARVSARRREHIERVVALLAEWASAMRVPDEEAAAWRDAGRWHDAFRDATEAELRETSGRRDGPAGLLHGPAAVVRLRDDGERREPVLSAIAWHTVGHPGWDRTGRALFMADFLEPGRPFLQAERAELARRVPTAFHDVFREVVRSRIEWTLREGKQIFPETVELWNSVR